MREEPAESIDALDGRTALAYRNFEIVNPVWLKGVNNAELVGLGKARGAAG